MNAPTKTDPSGKWPEGELATATNFVRHFGHYAASSLSKPVYIAQHGRIGWALLSAAEMTRLSDTETEASCPDARFDFLMDSISTIVVLVDATLQITRMNSSARRHFERSESGTNPLNLRTLLLDNHRAFIGEVCTRVLDTGETETFDLDSARYPGRTLHFQIMPFTSGLVVMADYVTQATRSRQVSSAAAAADLAVDTLPLLGRGRVDVRGAIITSNNNLVALAQSTTEKITGLRLAALFEQGSRNQVRDAMDDLLGNGDPFTIEAAMLNGTNVPVPVTVGAGAERDGGSIAGASFVVMPRC